MFCKGTIPGMFTSFILEVYYCEHMENPNPNFPIFSALGRVDTRCKHNITQTFGHSEKKKAQLLHGTIFIYYLYDKKKKMCDK